MTETLAHIVAAHHHGSFDVVDVLCPYCGGEHHHEVGAGTRATRQRQAQCDTTLSYRLED